MIFRAIMALPRKLAAGWVRAARMTPEVSRSRRWISRGRALPGLAKAQSISSRVTTCPRPPWLDRPGGLFRASTDESSWKTKDRTRATWSSLSKKGLQSFTASSSLNFYSNLPDKNTPSRTLNENVKYNHLINRTF